MAQPPTNTKTEANSPIDVDVPVTNRPPRKQYQIVGLEFSGDIAGSYESCFYRARSTRGNYRIGPRLIRRGGYPKKGGKGVDRVSDFLNSQLARH